MKLSRALAQSRGCLDAGGERGAPRLCQGGIPAFHSEGPSPPHARPQTQETVCILTPLMDAALIRLIRQRANGCCEYCQMPQAFDAASFEIDHIISRKHLGHTVASNLCLSCFYCNSFKGSDIAGLERKTRQLTPLFNPRRHRWSRHFRWQGAYLVGRTPIGRVTIALLHINDHYRVELLEELIEDGVFPPR